MIVFIANRLVLMALTMVISSFLVFGIMEFSPGNVASKTLGPYASDESKKVLFEKLQLGDPLLVRYGRWAGVLTGLIEDPLADPALDLGFDDPRFLGFRGQGGAGVKSVYRSDGVDEQPDREQSQPEEGDEPDGIFGQFQRTIDIGLHLVSIEEICPYGTRNHGKTIGADPDN